MKKETKQLTNTIYAMQINGATVLVLSPIDGEENLLRFRVEKVGAQFALKDIAEPGDSVFFAKLNLPAGLK